MAFLRVPTWPKPNKYYIETAFSIFRWGSIFHLPFDPFQTSFWHPLWTHFGPENAPRHPRAVPRSRPKAPEHRAWNIFESCVPGPAHYVPGPAPPGCLGVISDLKDTQKGDKNKPERVLKSQRSFKQEFFLTRKHAIHVCSKYCIESSAELLDTPWGRQVVHQKSISYNAALLYHWNPPQWKTAFLQYYDMIQHATSLESTANIIDI